MTNYIPKPDIEGINTSEKSTPIRDLLLLTCGFFAILLVAFFALSSTTDFFLKKITINDEIRFFSRPWASKALTELRTGDISKIELTSISEKLKGFLGFPVQLSVVCLDQANAFAFPGGHIQVTSKLLDHIRSENALLFVIGHEIGHILNRDHLSGLGRSLVFLLISSALSFDFGGSPGFDMFSQILNRQYSLEQERAADEYGLKINQHFYGHTNGAEEFFLHLKEESSNESPVWEALFSSHPVTTERIEKIKNTQKIRTTDTERLTELTVTHTCKY